MGTEEKSEEHYVETTKLENQDGGWQKQTQLTATKNWAYLKVIKRWIQKGGREKNKMTMKGVTEKAPPKKMMEGSRIYLMFSKWQDSQ